MNSKRGGVTFEADGQTHTLRLTTNAMVQYEDKAGHSVITALQNMEGGEARITDIRRLFAVMLGDLSEENAGEVIDAIGLQKAAEKIGEAARLAFPQSSAAGNGKAPSRKRATS